MAHWCWLDMKQCGSLSSLAVFVSRHLTGSEKVLIKKRRPRPAQLRVRKSSATMWEKRRGKAHMRIVTRKTAAPQVCKRCCKVYTGARYPRCTCVHLTTPPGER